MNISLDLQTNHCCVKYSYKALQTINSHKTINFMFVHVVLLLFKRLFISY